MHNTIFNDFVESEFKSILSLEGIFLVRMAIIRYNIFWNMKNMYELLISYLLDSGQNLLIHFLH